MRTAVHGPGGGARARCAFVWLVVVAVVAAGSVRAEPEADPGASPVHFREALAQLERAPALRGARLGVLVVDLASGEPLLAREHRRPMVPASSQKLLLASAALAHWGPAHRFSTALFAEGGIDDQGVVPGRLWVAGSGDPSLVSESLWKLSEELRLRGVRQVRGGLGIDASYFDRRAIHPDWEPVSARAYHAPVSAFAVNYSSFRVDVSPGPEPDAPVSVAVAPAARYFRVRSGAVTVARGARLQLGLDLLSDGSGERVRVGGSLAARAGPQTYWRRVSAPEQYAASVLRMQLESQGIGLRGSARLGDLPEGVTPLLEFRGEPLALVVRSLNKYSNNFIAEQLTKALGAEVEGPPGSWEKGTRAIRQHLGGLGLVDPGFAIADGSGLSERNRLTARMLVGVIRHARDAIWGPEFLASLPLAARDGTLEERFEDAAEEVRGKTGHLRSVASLAGVVRDERGRELAFAVLANGVRSAAPDVDRAIDRFVAALRAAPLADAESLANASR